MMWTEIQSVKNNDKRSAKMENMQHSENTKIRLGFPYLCFQTWL